MLTMTLMLQQHPSWMAKEWQMMLSKNRRRQYDFDFQC
jgi:hypothetical protein